MEVHFELVPLASELPSFLLPTPSVPSQANRLEAGPDMNQAGRAAWAESGKIVAVQGFKRAASEELPALAVL